MKKLPILLLAFVALLGFNSCSSDDDVVFIAQPDPEGISFVNTFSSNYVLTSATGENIAERFVWNEIDVEIPTNLSYEVQASATADFEGFTPMGSTSENNLAITVKQMMELAEEAGMDNDPETEAPNTGTLYFRVVGSPGTAGDLVTHTSEAQALTVTLPASGEEEVLSFRDFFLVGDATAAGWNTENNNTPLFRDAANEDLYHFTGRFAGGADIEGFKLVEILGNWQPQWGVDPAGELTSNEILGEEPVAFVVETDEYYTLTVNADELSFTMEPYDASADATYTTIGIVGDATPGGWNDDTLLTQSDFDPHIWFANGVEISDGEFKFRIDPEWTVDWGGSNFPSDQGQLGGDNIKAVGGVYDIWFNDITGHYIFIPQE